VQVAHREASAARQPHGPPSIEHHILLELKPFSHRFPLTLAPESVSDEEARGSIPALASIPIRPASVVS